MINNRQQNGRRRGRGGNNGGGGGTGGGGGGGPRQGGQGRGDNGNRIDSRARGNASQLLEKYKNLASDSQRQGDRVNTEYYLQFADHYFRVLADQRGRVEDNQPRRQQRDEFDGDGDEYYGDEGEPMRAGELQQSQQPQFQQPQSQQPQLQQPQSQQGDDGQGDRQGNYRRERGERDRPDRGERQERADRPERTNAASGNGERQDRNDGDQPRPPRNWEARPEREPRGERDQAPRRARPERDQQSEQPTPRQPEQQAAQPDLLEQAGAPANEEAPRRRGRPRREPVVEATESTEASASGFELDRLPPSLGISAVTNDGEDAAPKPRRRRVAARPSEVPTAAE